MVLSKFSVIKFKVDKSIEFVPSTFIDSTLKRCRYPTKKLCPNNFEDLRRNADYLPPDSWPSYKIKFYCSYDSAELAYERVDQLLITSDSEAGKARKTATIPTDSSQEINFVDISSIPSSSFFGSSIQPQPINQQPSHHLGLTSANVPNGGDPENFVVNPGYYYQSVNFSPASVPQSGIEKATSNSATENSYLITGFTGHTGIDTTSAFRPSSTVPKDDSKNIEELLIKVLENQKILESQISDIKATQVQILGQLQKPEGPDLSSVPKLPLTSKQDLNNFEKWLENRKNFQDLTLGLSKLGGARCTYVILNYIFLHQFALVVRKNPSEGKIALGSSKVVELVQHSVRCSFPNAVNTDISKYIWAWFRTSGDRRGGRSKRKRPSHTKEDNQTQSSDGGETNNEQLTD